MTPSTTSTLSPSERDRVLRATIELCSEQGYEETTAEQIARRAGIPIDTFRDLFPGEKEACLLAAERALLSEVVAIVSSAYDPDRPEMESAIHGVKAVLEMMAAHPSLAALGYIAARQMGPRSVYDAYEAALQVFAAMLERGTEYGCGDALASASAARGAMGAAEAVIRREIIAGRTEQLPRLLPDLIYGATVPFAGQAEALRLHARARELVE
jgi:AcrR family transcriptional regulator